MLRAYFLIFLLVAWVCGETAAAYLKAWEDGEERSPSPYEQAMLKRLQTYLDAEDRQRFADADIPAKRQMRYSQCYFNPISCFKRRK
ncbi:Allatostatin like protein [Argiope bruennichi]|uniref:Allatostatin like protein n=1 Tax=Argiope bruennichi TaxID=94029 RepID=A0A8T0FQG6_ARGBR|nr:Allatostatin like protein [Argiope bruennichi]